MPDEGLVFAAELHGVDWVMNYGYIDGTCFGTWRGRMRVSRAVRF